MSYLSDSDDSDNEFLNEEPAFAKPEPAKRQTTSLKALRQMAFGTPIEASAAPVKPRKRKRATNKKPAKKAKPSKQELLRLERQNDPQWIEEQARKTVTEVLQLDVVDKITDLKDIGWVCYGRGKKADYYPAIISKNKAESETLLQRKKKKYKTLRIQYIGVDWNDACKHDEIASSKWIPYTSMSQSQHQQRLQNFLKTISKKSRFKNDPLDLKIEEFAVQQMWTKVKLQHEHRLAEEETERQSISVTRPSQVTQDSDHSSSQQLQDENDSDGSSSDDDDDDVSPSKRKQISLCVNDEIEFYEVMGTFGNPQSLRRARIEGIVPANQFPLVLSNSILPLPGTHRVRKLPDGYWQPIHDYQLQQTGLQSFTANGSALHKAAQKMRTVQAHVAKARDKFWKNEPEEKKEASCGIANSGGARLRRSRRSVRIGGK